MMSTRCDLLRVPHENRTCQNLCLLAGIWPSNNLADIVISAKNLCLKFLQYIAGIKGLGFMLSFRNDIFCHMLNIF